MGQKRMPKQQLVYSSLNHARWGPKTPQKETILLPNTSSPPRKKTCAQAYNTTLKDTIATQNARISDLTASLSIQTDEKNNLHAELLTTHSQLQSLEQVHCETNERLVSVQNDLEATIETIAEQNLIIQQKNQRINRLIQDKATLSARLACLKQELLQAVLRAVKEEILSRSSGLRIETLRTIERLNHTVDNQKHEKLELQRSLKSAKMRAQRTKTTLAATRAGLKSKSTYLATRKRAYNTQIRSFALAFTRAGCAQARLGPLLIRVGKLFGVQLNRSMSRRTVRHIITEAGIKVRLQLGYELVRTQGTPFVIYQKCVY
jgi:septal ring factor EnvC (AmiA/AmiB activator)